jgi:hypothetical protein
LDSADFQIGKEPLVGSIPTVATTIFRALGPLGNILSVKSAEFHEVKGLFWVHTEKGSATLFSQ